MTPHFTGSTGLSRRRLLQLFGGAGLAALAGCGSTSVAPRLLAAKDGIPRPWREALPSPWRFLPTSSMDLWADAELEQPDLLALSDGWLDRIPADQLQALGAPPLQGRLDAKARAFLASLPTQRAAQVLPAGVSPWVMIARRREPWLGAARRSWDVLLDPALQQRIVLPASPRWVMNLADQLDGDDPLPRLRRQLLTLDDRQALNWLLKGEARLVVLPLQRCMPLLRRDPRLTAVLPQSGAPLHWTLLVRPAQTREPLPRAWVEQAWSEPMASSLLRQGWRPPLSRRELEPAGQSIPSRWRQLVLPDPEIWSRCWSLPPVPGSERHQLVQRWTQSAP